jgi:DNA processing protein
VSAVTRDRDAAALALVSLPSITPGRLRALLERFGTPEAAVDAVRSGQAALIANDADSPADAARRRAVAREWRDALDLQTAARQLEQRGTMIWIAGADGYPIDEEIPDRPPILVAEGAQPTVLARPRAAVVGTRAASPHGLADARELGAHLADAGVTVISGMAIGIDGVAHEGALDAGGGVVGVVATGLDVEYPRRHTALYRRVRSAGVVVGEHPFGVGPLRARFPVRNRIIAGMADVVVVVEATLRGGARITAQYALDYGRTVLAVPGSRRNPAAAGTNALIADGAHPLLEWSDVTVALGLTAASRTHETPERIEPSADGATVLRALAGEAGTPDQLTSRTGLPPAQVAVAIMELDRTGWVTRERGAVWPR